MKNFLERFGLLLKRPQDLKDYLSGGLLSWCPTVRRHAIYVAQRYSEYAYIWPTLFSSPHKSALSEKKMRRSLCI